MAHARQMLAHLIEQLGGKGPGAHPRGIGFDDAQHGIEVILTNRETGIRAFNDLVADLIR